MLGPWGVFRDDRRRPAMTGSAYALLTAADAAAGGEGPRLQVHANTHSSHPALSDHVCHTGSPNWTMRKSVKINKHTQEMIPNHFLSDATRKSRSMLAPPPFTDTWDQLALLLASILPQKADYKINKNCNLKFKSVTLSFHLFSFKLFKRNLT